jgi:hypothetical protein
MRTKLVYSRVPVDLLNLVLASQRGKARRPPMSTQNDHRMATTAGPRHGGGTTGRVRVRTGTLAPCRRSAARVRGDRGPGYGRRPKSIAKR